MTENIVFTSVIMVLVGLSFFLLIYELHKLNTAKEKIIFMLSRVTYSTGYDIVSLLK